MVGLEGKTIHMEGRPVEAKDVLTNYYLDEARDKITGVENAQSLYALKEEFKEDVVPWGDAEYASINEAMELLEEMEKQESTAVESYTPRSESPPTEGNPQFYFEE